MPKFELELGMRPQWGQRVVTKRFVAARYGIPQKRSLTRVLSAKAPLLLERKVH